MAVSDFQIGLIILGALFLVAVWLVNKAQERRVQRSVEKLFGESRSDALLDSAPHGGPSSERTEPTLAGELVDETAMSAAIDQDLVQGDDLVEVNLNDAVSDLRREPGMAGGDETLAAASGAVSASPSEATRAPQVVIDEEIHATFLLAADLPVSGERILTCLHELRRAGRQSVSFVGASGDENWSVIRPGGRYDTILIAVQLANRSGPLNEIEFSEFAAAVQHAADQIPAGCDVPDMMETIARARALDARCAPLDAQVGINLVHAAGRWSGDLVARLAGDHQMILRADGRFHATDDHGHSLFTLQNGEGEGFRVDTLNQMSTDRLTLLLDVPQAARDDNNPAADPFRRMTDTAQALAAQLGATLVDDNMRTLTSPALAAIEDQIAPAYARLEAAGMRAGSARALALFS